MSNHETRLKRARQSLEGLSVADALGGFFEFGRGGNNHFVKNRKIPDVEWHFTDDTNMALSIYSILRQFNEIRQDELAQNFATHYNRSRGYGRGARHLLSKVQIGGNWRELTRSIFRNEGSYGNGGSMRVAPIGAYFADDINAVVKHARLSSEITHSHPEGIAGAIAVAVASSVAVSYRDKDKPTIPDFIDQVLPHIPDGEVKENCTKAKHVPADMPIDDVVMELGNGRNISAMDTVPLTLWCTSNWLDNFEEAFWQCASAGGDVDTTCAIVGGIIGSRSIESIPASWIQHREPLPDWAFGEVTKL
jgi:ADP-ribosylglycohydrolase